jgi:hypothetical protein
MDPTTCLEVIRRHTKKYLEQRDNDEGSSMDEYDLIEYVEAINNLDKWLVRGGMLPRQWVEPRGMR